MRFNDRTGEIRTMNGGLKAEIIKYTNNKTMDVRFENGAIAHNITYAHFLDGKVESPMIVEKIDDYLKITNPTAKNSFFYIDVEDYHIVDGLRWCFSHGYVTNAYTDTRLHRAIMNACEGEEVDHINGNRFDNRKSNLRICTHKENTRNNTIPSNNTSGYKGVSWDKFRDKWKAYIIFDKRMIHLGRFESKTEAAKAYNRAAIKHFGEFAKLNEI